MGRPRTVPRAGDLFVTTCPQCGRTRHLRTDPKKRRDGPCLSCQRRGKASRPAADLPSSFVERYRNGESAASLARALAVQPGTVIAALKRQGVVVRTMSAAITLIGSIQKVQDRNRELRAAGELSRRMSAGLQGIPRDAWQEFRSDHWKRERASARWRAWREAVFARDGYACVLCARRSGTRLHPHHIRMKSVYPELLYEVTNGATLCGDCHHAIRGREEDVAPALERLTGVSVIPVNARNTSQVCSACGALPAIPLTLSDRVYRCPACGLVLDRDANAARNIERLGHSRQSATPVMIGVG